MHCIRSKPANTESHMAEQYEIYRSAEVSGGHQRSPKHRKCNYSAANSYLLKLSNNSLCAFEKFPTRQIVIYQLVQSFAVIIRYAMPRLRLNVHIHAYSYSDSSGITVDESQLLTIYRVGQKKLRQIFLAITLVNMDRF